MFRVCRISSALSCTIAAGVLLCAAAASARTPAKAPFTVADSIQMTVLADPPARYARFSDTEIKRAPDGRHFFLVTRRGDLRTGTNENSLLVYDIEEVRKSLAGRDLPEPVELARFASSSNREAIGRARWLADSRTIAFLAENPGEVAQIYAVDIEDKKLHKLTSHPTAILSFDLSASGDKFIYAAPSPLDWSERIAHGYAVGTESIIDVMGKGHSTLFTRIAYYVGSKSSATATPVDLPPYALQAIDFPWDMWISPQGRWAVMLQHAPALLPATRARFMPEGSGDAAADDDANDTSSFVAPHPNIPLQYMLVDLDTGHGRPLVDAPAGLYIGGTELKAYWADASHVVVSNTLLPYENLQGEERALRRTTPAIVEVDVATGKLQPIVDLTSKPRFAGTAMNAAGELVVHWSGDAKPTVYKRSEERWSTLAAQTPTASMSQLVVNLVQSVNQPPEIQVSDPTTGRSKIITDLNPRLRELELGSVESIAWKDAAGHEWSGGLLKPTHYQPGKRYPLVIQGHGYYPNIFLVDGADGCAAGCSARALANRGIAVVQMKDIGAHGMGSRAELDNAIAGYAALIDKLDKEGLIDRARVGLHGWSRTGYYVQHALAFSDLRLAAASVADPSQVSAYFYTVFYGGADPGMLEVERMMGVPLWGEENAQLWAQRDPMFHLSRVNTPLRIEMYEWGHGWWDMFTILRRNHRPVEYISLPDATHNPFKAWERLTSQQGTVDWYDFWLNGHEDPDPAKAEQYRRWRELRRWRDREGDR